MLLNNIFPFQSHKIQPRLRWDSTQVDSMGQTWIINQTPHNLVDQQRPHPAVTRPAYLPWFPRSDPYKLAGALPSSPPLRLPKPPSTSSSSPISSPPTEFPHSLHIPRSPSIEFYLSPIHRRFALESLLRSSSQIASEIRVSCPILIGVASFLVHRSVLKRPECHLFGSKDRSFSWAELPASCWGRARSACRGIAIVLWDHMDAAAGIDGVPSSQAARKEWQAVIEHSFGNNGGEVKSKGDSFIVLLFSCDWFLYLL